MHNHRQQLRQILRERRQAVPLAEQQQASESLAKQLSRTDFFQNSQKIAAYVAMQGEVDPFPTLLLALQQGKQCYLPIVNNVQQPQELLFAIYNPGDTLVLNRYKIPEPRFDPAKTISVSELDLVLTPLLGFDLQGNRLGMGGGYYDRTFAFLQNENRSQKPYLIGLGYDWQKLTELSIEPWDVPLNGVVTDKNIYIFK